MEKGEDFRWQTEQFGDVKILRYQVPMFEHLPLEEKLFVYYLSQAALAGRDILWDQNNCYNLALRRVLEKVESVVISLSFGYTVFVYLSSFFSSRSCLTMWSSIPLM